MAIKPALVASALTDAERTELYDAVTAWHNVTTQLAPLVEQEKLLRKALCDKWFTAPREGTNKISLGFGKELKMDFRINRKVDAEELDAAIAAQALPVDLVNELFNYKPSLATGVWKGLDDEQRKLFGNIVTEEPGTPGLSIETPKK